MYTLGINSVFHDSAACIVHDGNLLAAAEEERFTHIKHGKRPIPFSTYELPYHAIDFCLSKAGLHISDIDYFAYSSNPNLLRLDFSKGLQLPVKPTVHDDWNHLFYTSIQHAAHHLTDGFPHHLQQRFEGGVIDERHWCYVDHHLAHATSAFFPSPYKKSSSTYNRRQR